MPHGRDMWRRSHGLSRGCGPFCEREEYDSSREFGPWARRIAYFQTLAHLKRRTRSRESQFSDEMLEQLAVETERRSDALEDRLQALRSCLEKLPEKDRDLVKARYATGASVKAMAGDIGRSADAVSMHLYRLRQKLAGCIAQSLKLGDFQAKGGEG